MKTFLCLFLELWIGKQNRALEKMIGFMPARSIIDVSRNELNDEHMATIVRLGIFEKKAERLILYGNNFTWQSLRILMRALINNNHLKELDISRNYLGDRGVEILAEILILNDTLEIVDLSGNEITDDVIDRLVDALRRNKKLKRLYLNNNKITNQGLKSFTSLIINENCPLLELQLDANDGIDQNAINSFIRDTDRRYCQLEQVSIRKNDRAPLHESKLNVNQQANGKSFLIFT